MYNMCICLFDIIEESFLWWIIIIVVICLCFGCCISSIIIFFCKKVRRTEGTYTPVKDAHKLTEHIVHEIEVLTFAMQK